MGREPEDSKYSMVVLPLDQLGPLIIRHFESYPNTEILWGHKLVGVEQDANGATAVVETQDGHTKKITGDYLVGADGASSGVRTALFGKEYPGETLDQQIVATNVRRYTSHIVQCTDRPGLSPIRRTVQLLGLELHLPSYRLVYGSQDYQ
jgi:2-polyprenyl-6-methoxyphenol hydroxylase-like FAD-dependent oxidoreductase